MAINNFDLDSGALCLDFANTMEWHASNNPHDKLQEFADLIAWAETAEIVSADQARLLLDLADQQPQKARAAFKRAIELREVIYRIFAAYAGQETFEAADLAAFNQALSTSMARAQVMPVADGFAWGWMEEKPDFEEILWPVVRSAANLLTSDSLGRVRQCADDRGCGYLFVDMSRNRSRRWCSMESCGNRAKAQRHYERQKQADE
ncbi:MAG: CGNR zinc finger domain-containing protein [Candidatus Promineifilaceae bacterium]